MRSSAVHAVASACPQWPWSATPNAGKSSLTNRLTGSAELVENALFATLDTAVRRAKTRDGRAYAYVDTVGFVRRLPTQLVEAFKSTLEEVARGRRDPACGRWLPP